MIHDYTALDIETTGLDPKSDRIIEVGAVKVRNGEITDTFESLVASGKILDPYICELTGITQQMLEDAPKPEEVIPKLLQFIDHDILLGHSILFDYSFVKKAAVNMELTKGEKKSKNSSLPYDWFSQMLGLDTLKIARKFLPQLESRRLSYLCRYYDIPCMAHRACNDAKASVLLYEKLMCEFGECKSEGENVFTPSPLVFHVKKQGKASEKQKEQLMRLLRAHQLTIQVDLDTCTRNEISREIDRIIFQYGRI